MSIATQVLDIPTDSFKARTLLPQFDLEPRQVVWMTGRNVLAARSLLFQFMLEALQQNNRVFYIPRNSLALSDGEYNLLRGFPRPQNFTLLNLGNAFEATNINCPIQLIQYLIKLNPSHHDIVVVDQFDQNLFSNQSELRNLGTEVRKLASTFDITLVLGSIVPEIQFDMDAPKQNPFAMYTDQILAATERDEGDILVELVQSKTDERTQRTYRLSDGISV